jgi:hypothetical protein
MNTVFEYIKRCLSLTMSMHYHYLLKQKPIYKRDDRREYNN